MTDEGKLYVIATPIGNLGDVSTRSLEILESVDLIAAEDTRHSRKLLEKYRISNPMISFHQHNQKSATNKLLRQLRNGKCIALITDAGTPAVSDPGHLIVNQAHKNGFQVVPVPGASALTAALSVCGFPADKFVFDGFLPAKRNQRINRLEQLSQEERCIVLFEAPHRIVQTIEDMAQIFGRKREVCVAKEMTKVHETVMVDTLEKISTWITERRDLQKGEFVIVVESKKKEEIADIDPNVERALRVFLEVHSPKQAANLAYRIFGVRRNHLYRKAIMIKDELS